ncbi:MAG: NAD(P)-dependent alcohol dehydrogenase [Thermoanaerobaculia bacterium]
MRAILQKRYGEPREVLELGEIGVPAVGATDVLVRVEATSVHADVWHAVVGRPILARAMGGWSRPRRPVPGTDLAGVVEAVGEGVTRFRPGDAVFGESDLTMGWRHGGTFAELAAVPEGALETKPETVSFEQAAAVATSGHIALLNTRGSAAVEPGHRVLVNGAGGALGSILVQLVHARGATVTAVDREDKLPMLRGLGADRVVDYRREDVTLGGGAYDLILDVVSTLTLKEAKRVLAPGGIYVRIGHDRYGAAGGPVLGTLPAFFGLVARSPFDRHLPKLGSAPRLSTPEILRELSALLEDGTLSPVIDRRYPLAEAGEAMSYLQAGGGPGRIVLLPQALVPGPGIRDTVECRGRPTGC